MIILTGEQMQTVGWVTQGSHTDIKTPRPGDANNKH